MVTSNPAATRNSQLTAKQREVIRGIYEHFREHGRPPTVRELGASLGIKSTNGVMSYLQTLHRKGWVELPSGVARGIRLAGVAFVPVFTGDSAGQRLEAVIAKR